MREVLVNEGKRKVLLQLFGEGDGGGSEGGDGGGAGSGGEGGTDGGKGTPEPMSFEDFLKLEGNQAEFDRRLQKAVSTAVSKAHEKWEILNDEKLSEAEKLAKMTKEEQAAYKTKKLEEEVAALKREKAAAELAAEARKTLADAEINVPDKLLVNLVGADAAETKANVEEFSTMYKEAVKAGVKEALKGEPPKGGNGGTPMTKEEIYKIADPIERQKKIAENIDLFQN